MTQTNPTMVELRIEDRSTNMAGIMHSPPAIPIAYLFSRLKSCVFMFICSMFCRNLHNKQSMARNEPNNTDKAAPFCCPDNFLFFTGTITVNLD
jgi:hypothetical protein